MISVICVFGSLAGDSDFFVVQWSASGEARWARRFGGLGQDEGKAVAVAPDGTIYVTGFISRTVELPGAPALDSAGSADVVLAGGVDEMTPLTHAVLDRFRAVTPERGEHATGRAFDASRDGALASEGACMLVLERAAAAAERGARVLARVEATVRANDPTVQDLGSGPTAELPIPADFFDDTGAIAEVYGLPTDTEIPELVIAGLLTIAGLNLTVTLEVTGVRRFGGDVTVPAIRLYDGEGVVATSYGSHTLSISAVHLTVGLGLRF